MKRTIAVVALAACAPISTQTRNSETLLSSERVRDKAGEPSIVGGIQLASDALIVETRVEHRCRETLIERTRTTRHVTRSADKLFLGFEIGLGIVFGASGGGLVLDSGAEQRQLFTDAEPELERTVGIATAAVGGIFLLAAIIDGTRARDRVEELGEASRRRPAGTVAQACGEKPGAGLTIAATNARGEAVLGSTDRGGKLSLPLLSFPGALVDGANPPAEARIVVRTEEGTVELGVVNLSSTRHAHATRARADAETTNVPERWDDLAARFPEEHAAESTRRAREMRLSAARASLAAGDLVAARVTLGVLEQRDRDDAEVLAFATELKEREVAHEREQLWRTAATVTAALGPTSPVDQFDAAAEAITTAEARGADARAGELRATLDAARAQRLAAALGAVKQARQDLAAARAAAADAEALAPADARVVKAKRELDVREATQLAKQARTRASAKDWAEAATLYARAAELNPRDRSLARERDRMQKKSEARTAAAAASAPPVAVAAPTTAAPATASSSPPTTTSPSVTTTIPPTASAPDAATPATTAANPTTSPPATSVATTAPIPAVSVPRPTSSEATGEPVPESGRARASARFLLAPRVGPSPIDWAFLPRGCSGQFAGAELRVTCSDAQVQLLRTETTVDATCEADSCDRCTQLQTSILGRAKLDKAAARCEEGSP